MSVAKMLTFALSNKNVQINKRYLPRQRTHPGGGERRSGQTRRRVPADPSEEGDEAAKKPWKGNAGW